MTTRKIIFTLLSMLSLSTVMAHTTDEPAKQLVVNELMQSNIDCVMDDLNDFPDSWVELYNAGSAVAQLSQYRIGITPRADEAWPLPSRRLEPGGRIVVYCDKVGSGLHTPFRLESGKGCAVYLFLNGVLTDSVTGLKKQPAPNISYGRRTDGSSDWGYQLTPTPAQPNCGEVCDHDHILGAPVFSEQGRVITSSTNIRLTLSIPEGSPEGTEIRFTTNGTEPTPQSSLYSTPFVFNGSRVIRAKLFCQGWLSPRSVTQSYIFFPRPMTLPIISIATDNRYLNSAQTGIFTNNNGDKRVDWRRPINIEFFFDEGEESSINQLCETRIAGAASRGAQFKSMAIYAHKRFGEKRFDYEFFPDQCPGLTDYKSLVLRNAGNDFDYLYMRDAIVQRSMASHVDLDWQAWRPAVVYINGTYHCMLNIRERANENNIITHYDGLEDIDLIENWNDLKEGTMDNLKEFKAFYNEHGHTLAEYEERMDCQEFINIMVMNLYFNNFDFPGNNIIMWRPRAEGGRWRWVAKDCDYVMGLYGQGNSSYKILDWLHNPSYDGQHNWGANSYDATRLFRRLMEDKDFSLRFTDCCAIYMGDFLNERGVRAVWDPMYEQIKNEYPVHRKLINQWWPNYNDELRSAQNWLAQRTDQFYSHVSSYYNLSTPIPMTLSWTKAEGDEEIGISFNGIRLSEGTFNGKYFLGRQFTLEASPGSHREVSGWNVTQVGSGGTTTKQVDGPVLSMQMPRCSRLVVNPIIRESTDIASLTTPTWTVSRTGNSISLAGITPGMRIAVYDLRGMLLSQTTATSQQVTLTIPAAQVCVLKVGSQVIKLSP